jgi:DNA-binding transcriptional ArsR family regulator
VSDTSSSPFAITYVAPKLIANSATRLPAAIQPVRRRRRLRESATPDILAHRVAPGDVTVYALTRIYVSEYVVDVTLDAFTVLAEPTRRRILDELVGTEASVGALVAALALPQPTVSKHLRVLRDAGFVSCRSRAQQRIYRVEAEPLQAVATWLEPYRRLWDRHLDALERHLDTATSPED